MITTTLVQLIASEDALGRIMLVKFDKEGGAKVRYHVAKLATLVAIETKHYHSERNELVKKYGEGNPPAVMVNSKNWEAFASELKAVGEVEVSIPWEPITDTMIEPYSDITPADMFGLGPLFDFSERSET